MGTRQSVPATRLRGGGTVNVVGESHYQDELDAYCGGRTEEGHEQPVMAVLVLEPQSEHDPEAVAVHLNGGGQVGYLSRHDARAYGSALRLLASCGSVAVCDAEIRGGWDRGDGDVGHYGVRLDLASPAEVLAEVEENVAEFRRQNPDSALEQHDAPVRKSEPRSRRPTPEYPLQESSPSNAALIAAVVVILALVIVSALMHG